MSTLLTHLPLPRATASAAQARRWAAEVCTTLGLDDFSDCAELGVSELVTNALLYGGDPISAEYRIVEGRLRFEVRDHSPEPPFPYIQGERDSFTTVSVSTFGRGLQILAMVADAWGVVTHDDHKVIWFEPASAARDEPSTGTVEQPSWPALGETFQLEMLSIDVLLLADMLAHHQQVHREIRLLALEGVVSDDTTTALIGVLTAFTRQFTQDALTYVAPESDEDVVTEDLYTWVSPQSEQLFSLTAQALQAADDLLAQHGHPHLVRTPKQKALQAWLFHEFKTQAKGQPSTPWDEAFWVPLNFATVV